MSKRNSLSQTLSSYLCLCCQRLQRNLKVGPTPKPLLRRVNSSALQCEQLFFTFGPRKGSVITRQSRDRYQFRSVGSAVGGGGPHFNCPAEVGVFRKKCMCGNACQLPWIAEKNPDVGYNFFSLSRKVTKRQAWTFQNLRSTHLCKSISSRKPWWCRSQQQSCGNSTRVRKLRVWQNKTNNQVSTFSDAVWASHPLLTDQDFLEENLFHWRLKTSLSSQSCHCQEFRSSWVLHLAVKDLRIVTLLNKTSSLWQMREVRDKDDVAGDDECGSETRQSHLRWALAEWWAKLVLSAFVSGSHRVRLAPNPTANREPSWEKSAGPTGNSL